MASITCSGNPAAVLKALKDAGAEAELTTEGDRVIVSTRLGRELLGPEDVVTSEVKNGKTVFIVESTRANNPDSNFTGEPQ